MTEPTLREVADDLDARAAVVMETPDPDRSAEDTPMEGLFIGLMLGYTWSAAELRRQADGGDVSP